ncbi:hypothetical protein K525DRAFT_273120 [Schizophyllum commune Loenen D]|nr:hypothetical protein K525DRAFT_273120 [Schizophyllum commune Loenen D]
MDAPGFGWRLELPNRDPKFPDLYMCTSHPQVERLCTSARGHVKRIIYYHVDTSKAHMAERRAWAKGLGVPYGPAAQMQEKGLFEVKKGDMVYARIDDDPNNDMLQIWPAGLDAFDSSSVERYGLSRSDMLGTREYRVEHKGLTYYENCPNASSTQDRRCFGNGEMRQKPRNVTAPSVGGNPNKVTVEEFELRRKIVFTSTEIGVHALRSRAPEIHQHLHDQCEVVNAPKLGVDDNYAFHNLQLNFYGASTYESQMSMGAMGKSGEAHVDEEDGHAGVSAMIAWHDLPDGYEAGRFHFLELGAYIMLQDFVVVCFSSLYRHGGTPPIAPQGEKVVPWACRFNAILYGNRYAAEGDTWHSLAALPGARHVADDEDAPLCRTSSVFRISPYATNPIYDELLDTVSSNECTYTCDGKAMMSPKSLVNYYSRAQYQHFVATARQLQWPVHADYEMFRQSTSFEIEGEVITPDPWPYAPDGTPFKIPRLESEEARQILDGTLPVSLRNQAILRCASFAAKRASVIPYVAGQYDEFGNRIYKAGANASPTAKKKEGAGSRGLRGKVSKKPFPVRLLASKGWRAAALKKISTAMVKMKKREKTKRTRAAATESVDSRAASEESTHAEITHITGHRLCKDGENLEYRVKWAGFKRLTWVHQHDMNCCDDLLTAYHRDKGIILPQQIYSCDAGSDIEADASSDLTEDLEVDAQQIETQMPMAAHAMDVDVDEDTMAYTVDIAEWTGFESTSFDLAVRSPSPTSPSFDLTVRSPSPMSTSFDLTVRSPSPRSFEPPSPVTTFDPRSASTEPLFLSEPDMNVNTPEYEDPFRTIAQEPSQESAGELPSTSSPATAQNYEDAPLIACLAGDGFSDAAATFKDARAALKAGFGRLSAGDEAIEKLEALNKVLGSTAAALVLREHDHGVDLSIPGMQAIIQASEKLHQVGQHIAISEADMMLYQQSVILAQITFDHWLRSMAAAITARGASYSNTTTWFVALYQRAVAAVDQPAAIVDDANKVSFIAPAELAIPPERSYIVDFPNIATYRPPSERKGRSARITSLLLNVVYTWFAGQALTSEQEARYEICATVLQHYKAPGVFLLTEVWHVFKSPTGFRSKRPHRKNQSFQRPDLRRLVEAIKLLPTATDGLSSLEEEVTAYVAERQDEYQHPRKSMAGRNSMQEESAQSEGEDNPVAHDANINNLLNGLSTEESSEVATPLQIAHAKEHMLRFLRDLAPLIGWNTPGQQPPADSAPQLALLEYTSSRQDQRLPFRERAPSRQRICRDDGPFHPDRVLTRAGIFSILVFRGILFASEKLLEDEELTPTFADLEAFERWRGTGSEDKFCVKNAYGQTNLRNTRNASRFWDSSKSILPYFNAKKTPLSFSETVQKIRTVYTFGPLVAYLTAVDLAYAGQVQHPTSVDIATYSTMGAMRGMGKLGLPHATPEQRAQTFEALYQSMTEEITEEEKHHWVWDRALLEHALSVEVVLV